ncbi:hypothetical protein [Corynebacterium spheniscorum]|uniref:Uncharacterized protein n=1 Tax=Corynebacterium spheniscorum TaxID=185761 RepID=A0A1I2TCC0_9CORY|nr:hypothetical protein [Corynebacterium spheniscorum]KAA8719877.1 hypothetical protein F4V56_08935 [Corynebacterium spheniscorum]SFG62535.1 hypothetical protein SAMN05660282_01415 [Corynebacterium spheniscorum]
MTGTPSASRSLRTSGLWTYDGVSRSRLAVYVLLALGGMWVRALHYLPTGLASTALALARGAEAERILWPCITSVLIISCCVGVGLYIFGRSERI